MSLSTSSSPWVSRRLTLCTRHRKWSSSWRCPTCQAARVANLGLLRRCTMTYIPPAISISLQKTWPLFLGAHLNGGVFNGHRILSEESVLEMHTPQFGGTYGFGWSVKEDDNGHTIISHGGGIPGQSSFMMGDVDARVGVYYMSNSGAPQEIAKAAIALLRGEEYTPPAKKVAIAVAREVLSTYVGTYVFNAVPITVTQQDRKLFMEGLGQGKNELLADPPTTFFIEGGELSFTFVADETGTVTHFVVEAGGQSFIAKRSW